MELNSYTLITVYGFVEVKDFDVTQAISKREEEVQHFLMLHRRKFGAFEYPRDIPRPFVVSKRRNHVDRTGVLVAPNDHRFLFIAGRIDEELLRILLSYQYAHHVDEKKAA